MSALKVTLLSFARLILLHFQVFNEITQSFLVARTFCVDMVFMQRFDQIGINKYPRF